MQPGGRRTLHSRAARVLARLSVTQWCAGKRRQRRCRGFSRRRATNRWRAARKATEVCPCAPVGGCSGHASRPSFSQDGVQAVKAIIKGVCVRINTAARCVSTGSSSKHRHCNAHSIYKGTNTREAFCFKNVRTATSALPSTVRDYQTGGGFPPPSASTLSLSALPSTPPHPIPI